VLWASCFRRSFIIPLVQLVAFLLQEFSIVIKLWFLQECTSYVVLDKQHDEFSIDIKLWFLQECGSPPIPPNFILICTVQAVNGAFFFVLFIWKPCNIPSKTLGSNSWPFSGMLLLKFARKQRKTAGFLWFCRWCKGLIVQWSQLQLASNSYRNWLTI
jgi:hypothetical protein